MISFVSAVPTVWCGSFGRWLTPAAVALAAQPIAV
jgi:hypothetical protein